jgi:hypothetical protein
MSTSAHDVVPVDDPIGELAAAVRELVEEVRGQNTRLDEATSQLSRGLREHRRRTLLGALAVIVPVAIMLVVLGLYVIDTRGEAVENCRADNRATARFVDAYDRAVHRSAAVLAGDDPVAQAQADAVADDLLTEVAADPRFQPRDC